MMGVIPICLEVLKIKNFINPSQVDENILYPQEVLQREVASVVYKS